MAHIFVTYSPSGRIKILHQWLYCTVKVSQTTPQKFIFFKKFMHKVLTYKQISHKK